jgi:hypothetical protein
VVNVVNMDERLVTAPEAEDDEQGEFEVTGDEATARWRAVRLQFYGGFAAAGAGLLASWLWWHRSLDQLAWIGLGLGAASLAVLIWKHDLIGFSYTKTGGPEPKVTFAGKRPPVPRELATPALLLAAAALLLAGTSTGIGRRLASVFGVVETLYDAGRSALSPGLRQSVLMANASGLTG